jgi:hypothetical protein
LNGSLDPLAAQPKGALDITATDQADRQAFTDGGLAPAKSDCGDNGQEDDVDPARDWY